MGNTTRGRAKIQRSVALCYIRQSFTRAGEPDDLNSPDRQRANILAACNRNGWTPEWYEDVGGHKSGRSEKNRPQWLALKARLSDPDVTALVANDLSRLHRKGWRVGDLIEFLNEHDVNLVLAAPGRDVDTTTMKGRMFLQFGAIIDEFYAEDISQRAKDSILYRKSMGKSVGIPPFGTIRNQDGYLIPSVEGAWLLPTGQWVAGRQGDSSVENGIWRGYHDAAHQILTLYAKGNLGLEKVAYRMNKDGWAFRNRDGAPRPFDREDIRRIVCAWPEYGGMITGSRGKDRHAYEKINIEEILFKEDRAVFPVPLLRTVAQTRQDRAIRPIDQSIKITSHAYPLSALTYCARCEQLAAEQANPRLRSLLSGNMTMNNVFRYRHKLGVNCGCLNRSVACDVVEKDFVRLLQLLTVRPDAQEIMTTLAIEMDMAYRETNDPETLEKEKQKAIATCRRRIDAAVILFGDGVIDKDEYRRRLEQNERELIHWETRTSEIQKIGIELAMCVDAVNRLAGLWDISTDEDKRGLARSLFTELAYDLDTQRIVSFKLQPWADRFLTVRANSLGKEDTGMTPTSSGIVAGTDVSTMPLGGTCVLIHKWPNEVYPRDTVKLFCSAITLKGKEPQPTLLRPSLLSKGMVTTIV